MLNLYTMLGNFLCPGSYLVSDFITSCSSCLPNIALNGLGPVKLFVYSPLFFVTFFSFSYIAGFFIVYYGARARAELSVLPDFNYLAGAIIGGILISCLGFYLPLPYLNLFNELNNLDYSLACLMPAKCYSNALEEKSAIVGDNRGKSGVYVWKNKVTGSIYVGSSIDLGRRFREYYRFDLLANKRPNSIIHRAILQYGYAFLSLDILEYCDKQETFIREQYYLDLLKPDYNILKVAGVYAGHKHSEDVRRDMSESRMGKKFFW
jgi:hypothetical protein